MSELTVILFSCLIVGASGILFSGMHRKMDKSTVDADTGLPFVPILAPKNSLESTRIVEWFLLVSEILSVGALAKVYSTIVERIVIAMVNFFSLLASENESLHVTALLGCVKTICRRAPRGVPIPSIKPIKISGINDGILPLCEGDKAVWLVKRLSYFVSHYTEFFHLPTSNGIVKFSRYSTILATLFLLFCFPIFAQNSTSVTIGPITDSGGITWASGTWTLTFVGQPNSTWPGGNLARSFSGSLSGAGSASQSTPSNATIQPSPSFWNLTVCPNVSVTVNPSGCVSQQFTISGSTQTISITPAALVITVPLVSTQINPVVAYADAEISGGWVGFTYYNLTNAASRQCTAVSTSGCTTWAATTGGGGSGINPLGTAGNLPQFASYTFYINSGTVYARNNSTGAIDFSGTDAAVVFNNVTTANATTGGTLFFKNGVYPVNSLTNESATGCSNFDGSGKQISYALHFPAQSTFVNSVDWVIEGEGTSVWQGEEGSTSVNNSGVVFNITPTAVSSVTAGNILVGFWQSPVTNCTLTTAATNINNELVFNRVTVRFPVNTRGNEIAYAPYFATTIQYGPTGATIADFNVAYNTIATGSAPTAGTYNSIGFASTISSSGNVQDFRNTYAVGYNLGYDFQSEHVTGTNLTAIYNNIACEFGRSGGNVFHPVHIDHFIDQENGQGCIWGASVLQGTLFDIYFDFEFGNDANWYTAARAKTTKLSETNVGFGTGILRYQTVVGNTGISAEIPANTLFTAGGQNFQAIEGTVPPSFALLPISDTFTRPNSTAGAALNGLGPMWAAGTQSGNNNLTIVSNSAQVNHTGVSAGYSVYLAQPMNADQFSKVTCSTLTATTGDFCEVLVRGTTNPAVQTYYNYYIGGTAASGRGIQKVVAGVSTTLASQTASAGAAGDVLELDVIGNTLWAYRNGALDTSFTNPVTDSAITSGAPGINLVDQTTAAVAATNWLGGSFPTMHGTDSIYNNPSYRTTYLSLGVPPTPTGTGACATITTQVPSAVGSQAGSLKCTGTTGASTITLTWPVAQTAPNGYRCSADDETTAANKPTQTSHTTTTCVLTVTSVTANDVIVWNASPF